MNARTDQQLLRDYAERHSEAAFAELVRRHIDLVYSAALRMVCDSHQAEDVTQSVFVALAQNARQLTRHPVLSGWLHRTTQNLAANAVRTNVRRQAREQEAIVMNELLSAEPDLSRRSGTEADVWEHIAPHLDAALGELNEPDRDALLLRYFERKSAREMAQTLGISDEAAQKRVSRAVERLREFFAKRGVTVGAGGLVVVISANAVQAAPVGLAITISTVAAIAGTATVTTSTTIATMNMINIKTAAVIAASAILTGMGTYFVQQHSISGLRAENQRLAAKVQTLASERDVAFFSAAGRADELEQLQKDRRDLLRLRNEVGMLRRQTNEFAGLKAENQPLRANTPDRKDLPAVAPPADTVQENFFPKDSWTFAGYAKPEAVLQSFNWAALQGDVKTVLTSMSPEMQVKVKEQWAAAGKSESDMAALLPTDNDIKNVTGYRIVHKDMVTEDVAILTLFQEGLNRNKKVTVKRVGNEWKLAN